MNIIIKLDECMLRYGILVAVTDLYFVTPCIIEKSVFESQIYDCKISRIPRIRQLPWFDMDYFKQLPPAFDVHETEVSSHTSSSFLTSVTQATN